MLFWASSRETSVPNKIGSWFPGVDVVLCRSDKYCELPREWAAGLDQTGAPGRRLSLWSSHLPGLCLHLSGADCRSVALVFTLAILLGMWATRVTCPGLYICQFAGYSGIGGATQDVCVTPGFGPWKQTFSRSIMAWTQHGTRPGQRTLEAARGNGYDPVRGAPVMMMIMILCAGSMVWLNDHLLISVSEFMPNAGPG